jgi:hypothetical protein
VVLTQGAGLSPTGAERSLDEVIKTAGVRSPEWAIGAGATATLGWRAGRSFDAL